jgi:Mor family transcriptional regulator
MSKNNKKAIYNQYNPEIIKKLKAKYGLTTQFIGQSLRGDRTSDTSIKICEDYKLMETEIKKTLKNL